MKSPIQPLPHGRGSEERDRAATVRDPMGLRPSQKDEDAVGRSRGITDLDCVFNGAVAQYYSPRFHSGTRWNLAGGGIADFFYFTFGADLVSADAAAYFRTDSSSAAHSVVGRS